MPTFLQPIVEEFGRLYGHRQIGSMGGVGPVPIEAMETRLDRLGISGQERQEWIDAWTAMDGQFMSHQAKEHEKATKSKGAKKGNGAPPGHEEYFGGAEWDLLTGKPN